MLSPIEFKQYSFPPMDASTAAFSVHLSTGLTAEKTFVVVFLVVELVDVVEVVAVVVVVVVAAVVEET